MSDTKRTIATAVRKSSEWLAEQRVDVRSRKAVEALAVIAKQQYEVSEYAARIALANKALQILNRVGYAIRAGRFSANELDVKKVRAIIEESLSQWQAELIFNNTLRTAYNAGRYRQQMRDTKRTFLRYRTMRDAKVRDNHRKLEGVLLPKTHPFWSTHYPPNGHNCRCRVDSLTVAEARAFVGSGQARGEPDELRVPYIDTATGEQMDTPESIDPGWEGNPSRDEGRTARLLERSIQRLAKALQE